MYFLLLKELFKIYFITFGIFAATLIASGLSLNDHYDLQSFYKVSIKFSGSLIGINSMRFVGLIKIHLLDFLAPAFQCSCCSELVLFNFTIQD